MSNNDFSILGDSTPDRPGESKLPHHDNTNGEGDGETFQPASFVIEKSRKRVRPIRRKLRSLANMNDVAKNRYEGVLIASARARQLNAKKVALEERGLEEAQELKRLKMTTFALDELLDGKIKVKRPGDSI